MTVTHSLRLAGRLQLNRTTETASNMSHGFPHGFVSLGLLNALFSVLNRGPSTPRYGQTAGSLPSGRVGRFQRGGVADIRTAGRRWLIGP
jgi:hypothetical protein